MHSLQQRMCHSNPPWCLLVLQVDTDFDTNEEAESASDAQEVKATGVGSMSTFYHGKRAALRQLAEEKLGKGSAPFKFKSRAKHSMYKECHECQTKRLAVQRAIKYVRPRLLFALHACPCN